MATFNKNINNEHITNEIYELVNEVFDVEISDFISESGFEYELDFDKEQFIDKYSFADKVKYIITNRF